MLESPAAKPVLPANWATSSDPLVFAHRGGPGENKVENSLTAFKAALAKPISAIETDIRVTSDGVPVVLHDPSFIRVSDEIRPLITMSWKDAKAITLKDGSHPMRFDEVLEEFPDMVFNLDAKSPQAVEPLINTILAAKAEKRVCLATFSHRRMQQMRKLTGGEVATSLSAPEVVKLLAWSYATKHPLGVDPLKLRQKVLGKSTVAAVAAQVPDVFHGIFPVTTSRVAKNAEALGLSMQVWTVNSSEQLEKVGKAIRNHSGDGVISDFPRRAYHYLTQQQ
ncbi:hypothetical protein BSR29_06485 [Boudabousia liubingyangii]|uniref:GP-PDE domain-containing protein n=1 Tax=Boudabousia liubingyangii TaxID=1921764 RepID=A0A1Q5PKX5_9ACTO|nr:glycerophosphodiester phosphodiesterase family protein [Boudabousia liubingyangii]OKL47261.1 hypothetical protein BSR29_06485 [Boudabousia liubingyangii]